MMTSDMTMTERLMRQKNGILQRQLEVKLKILEIEHKTTQKQILESQRDCSLFLANVSNTWVGLDRYNQPDTRAMAKDASLKDRRVSMMHNGVNDNTSNDAEESPFRGQQIKNNMLPNGYLFPENRHGSDMSCLDVLDDILRGHWKGQQKQQRQRKMGTIVVPTATSLNSARSLHDGSNNNSSHTMNPRAFLSKNRRVASAPEVNRRVTLITDDHLLQSRQTSGLVTENKVMSKTSNLISSRTHNSSINGRPQTASENHLTSPRPQSKGLNKKILVRPQTAVVTRSDSLGMSWRHKLSVIIDPYAPLPGEECRRKRPKTAPTKYELYGRSPAIARRTVAGIMAEMNSRCAETRDHIKYSKDLKRIVKKLHGPNIKPEDILDD